MLAELVLLSTPLTTRHPPAFGGVSTGDRVNAHCAGDKSPNSLTYGWVTKKVVQ